MTPEKAWILRTNVYEVNLRQYTEEGTLAAFHAHLPRLRDMGVETLWFMPLTPIAQERKKGSLGSYYACSDFTAFSEEFGTMEEFKAFVQEAHGMGLHVIIDWVANHTGWDHRWTREHPDWYERGADGGFVPAHGMEDIIELDFNNRYMRAEMIDAMRYWVLEAGIDGFRCDLAFWVELDFWLEAKEALSDHPGLLWLGELDPLTHPEYMQVFDAAYTWSWMHAAQEFYAGRMPRAEWLQLLDRYKTTAGIPAWFTTNHDENSWNGTEYEKYGAMAAMLAVFGCTWPGIPLLYSGQELPNEKRLQFFEKDAIEWNGTPGLGHFYGSLLQLRRNSSALESCAPCRVLNNSADADVLVYLRESHGEPVLVLLNLTPRVQHCFISEQVPGEGNLREVITGMERAGATEGWLLPPWGYQVFVPARASTK
ncbi:MAG: 1,4-alpha-glucan branching protein [Chitinophagaceae bacterium]|nr:MAG: 1,4-alpha-glucan branching protein [Chitinophagaceae bacterium]